MDKVDGLAIRKMDGKKMDVTPGFRDCCALFKFNWVGRIEGTFKFLLQKSIKNVTGHHHLETCKIEGLAYIN